MVLTAEGRIYTWGRGSFGRLGTGTEKDCYSPVEVFLPGSQISSPLIRGHFSRVLAGKPLA
jgi:alpha-tubulin suppressor-like RCC1 family protein